MVPLSKFLICDPTNPPEEFHIEFKNVTSHYCSSTIRQDTEHEANVQHSSLRYKNSITSHQTHENWALVSTIAGTLPVLKSSITHRGTLLVAVVSICSPLSTTDREACPPLGYRPFPGRSDFWWQYVLRCPTWTHIQHFGNNFTEASSCAGDAIRELYLTLPEQQAPSILWCFWKNMAFPKGHVGKDNEMEIQNNPFN